MSKMQKDKIQLKRELISLLALNGLNQTDLAEMLGVTSGAVNQKISNFFWRYIDLVNLLDELGYDVVWVKRDNETTIK